MAKRKPAKKAVEKKDEPIVLHELKQHEIEMIVALQNAVNRAREEVNKVIYLLIGPEEVNNRSLKVNLDEKVITVDFKS